MALYTKESLENLRQKSNLLDVISSHVELKPSGSAYKGLCPFHDEKTPSFMISRGDTHYHCYGCGAHGDALQFLMSYLNIGFAEAVEQLASRFQVPLVKASGEEDQGPNKKAIKEALTYAARFYQYMLLYSKDGQEALAYLYRRGIDLSFIRRFHIGLAPREPGLFRKTLFSKRFSQEVLVQSGLLVEKEGGRLNDFFYDRITFPICDASGVVIGFSARKYREETGGGKYVNTSETAVFKKSRILFGLHHSRKRIAKERRVVIVEGQIDALRLIDNGLAMTVASQGTAFCDGHVRELRDLGVEQVFLAFDADAAGLKAAAKVGQLFQKEGVGVYVVAMPPGEDPDSYVRTYGPEPFARLLSGSKEYLAFLVDYLAKEYDLSTPAGKKDLVDAVTRQIRSWDDPVMIHESLRKAAGLLRIPEEVLGLGQQTVPHLYLKRTGNAGLIQVDPDRILETDLLRWIIKMGQANPHIAETARINLPPSIFRNAQCRKLFEAYFQTIEEGVACDLLTLAAKIGLDNAQPLIDEIMSKMVNESRVDEQFIDTIQKLLDREWMHRSEEIRMKITSGTYNDDEVLQFVKAFDDLKRSTPQVKVVTLESLSRNQG